MEKKLQGQEMSVIDDPPVGDADDKSELELMFMKHYAPNRCLYIKVAKLRTGVGSAKMSHLQNRCLKISG